MIRLKPDGTIEADTPQELRFYEELRAGLPQPLIVPMPYPIYPTVPVIPWRYDWPPYTITWSSATNGEMLT